MKRLKRPEISDKREKETEKYLKTNTIRNIEWKREVLIGWLSNKDIGGKRLSKEKNSKSWDRNECIKKIHKKKH